MSTRERVEDLLADVLPRLEALKEESMAEIGRVRRDANAKTDRHEEARAELGLVEEEIDALSAEKEELPVRHSRAVLEDDVDEELRLKQRFQDIGSELATLEDRRGSLKEELRQLSPRDQGHRNDAAIYHTGRVASTAYEERRALEELRDRLTKALDDAVGPVAKVHNDTRALVESWSTERKWAQRRTVA